MTDLERLVRIDPAQGLNVSDEVFENLRRDIVMRGVGTGPRVGRSPSRRRRILLLAAAAAGASVLAATLSTGPATSPAIPQTPWRIVDASSPLPFIPTSSQSDFSAEGDGLLTCPAAHVCYLVSYGPGDDRPPVFTTAYVTRDGGRRWKPTAPLPVHATFTAPFTCTGAHRCLAPGTVDGDEAFSFPGNPGPGIPVVFVTTNGGSSWQILPVPTSVGYIASLTCTSATSCLGVSFVNSTRPTPLSASSTAIDGGAIATWITAARHVVRTGDGGRTWDVVKNPVNGSPLDVVCSGSSTCTGLAVPGQPSRAPLTAYFTDDGGSSWTAGPLPGHLTRYGYGLACFDLRSCVAFDSNDIDRTSIFSSSDEGRTWRARPSTPGLQGWDMRSFSCTDRWHCWGIAGDRRGSAILATKDGGHTWAVATRGDRSGDIMNISCVIHGACTALEDTPEGTVTLTNGR